MRKLNKKIICFLLVSSYLSIFFTNSSKNISGPDGNINETINERNSSLENNKNFVFNDRDYYFQKDIFDLMNLEDALLENDDASGILVGVLDTGISQKANDLNGIVNFSLGKDFVTSVADSISYKNEGEINYV